MSELAACGLVDLIKRAWANLAASAGRIILPSDGNTDTARSERTFLSFSSRLAV